MISVISLSPRSNQIPALWLRDKLHPEWSDVKAAQWCADYFSLIEAQEFLFYEDGIPLGYLSTVEGTSLHYGRVLDTFTVTSPDARGNRALLKAMLEQSKRVCREAGIEWLVRSVHLSATISRVHYTRIIGGA